MIGTCGSELRRNGRFIPLTIRVRGGKVEKIAGQSGELAAYELEPQMITALFDAGVSRIEFGTPHGFSDAGGVRLLGEQVLPAFR